MEQRMKRTGGLLAVLIVSFAQMALVVRHDVPNQRYIELAKKYPQICHLPDGEATLIKENWLLTAAHVATILQNDLKKGNVPKIGIGDQKFDAIRVVLHPDYELGKRFIANDIALIKIKGNVKTIPVAKLYTQKDEEGAIITIVGRGDFGNGLSGPKLKDKVTRAATNRIEGVSDQWISFDFDAPESENTTELEGVSGPGDSGGPAFLDINGARYIVGVSSHQMNNGKASGVYGVTENYARVSTYKEWIEMTVK
ncbi:S1 family peptidase [Maribacter algicola]|uniref:S1 family peptidase n=1 Tax=Meishania litoralis TaxID=3434685 RepID=A0ACC7LKJ0_9FLAO